MICGPFVFASSISSLRRVFASCTGQVAIEASSNQNYSRSGQIFLKRLLPDNPELSAGVHQARQIEQAVGVALPPEGVGVFDSASTNALAAGPPHLHRGSWRRRLI